MNNPRVNLEAFFAVVLQEARENEAFAARLEQAISTMRLQQIGDIPMAKPARRRNRRAGAVLDPFLLFKSSEADLQSALRPLSLDQLRDIVSEYGMDGARLALKWKDPERLQNLIVETVRNRSRKGDAFRAEKGASTSQELASVDLATSLKAPVRKVIDFNAIASTDGLLEAFFESSAANIGVITDMMGIECLKREGVANYRKSFERLSRYSHRVLVLHPFQMLRRLRPKKDRYFEQIVDWELTKKFPQFCEQVLRNLGPKIAAGIAEEQARVQAFMGKTRQLVDEELRHCITDIEKTIPAAQLKEWRRGNPIGEAEMAFLFEKVAALSTFQYRHSFPNEPIPDAGDGLYWVPFRYSVALQALTLKWIRESGHETVAANKLRNDSVDIFYIAYGTLFDGVLTNDQRLLELFELSKAIVQLFFARARGEGQPPSFTLGRGV